MLLKNHSVKLIATPRIVYKVILSIPVMHPNRCECISVNYSPFVFVTVSHFTSDILQFYNASSLGLIGYPKSRVKANKIFKNKTQINKYLVIYNLLIVEFICTVVAIWLYELSALHICVF
jgi:hypothetical protein